VAAVVLIGVVSVGLALLLAALLPGAGLVAAVLVIAGGIGVIIWLVAAGGAGRTPSDAIRRTEPPPEHLGPGGPDDPNR
jgi:hypothetical protein